MRHVAARTRPPRPAARTHPVVVLRPSASGPDAPATPTLRSVRTVRPERPTSATAPHRVHHAPRGLARKVARNAFRFLAFYLLTAAFIVGGIAAHEYSHYAAHEGFGMPALQVSPSVASAQENLLQVSRSRGADGQDVLLQEPRQTTIVFFPNTATQALGLGLLPAASYDDGGVLASTFFRLQPGEAAAVQANGGEMSTWVVAAPLALAGTVFAVALAWTLWRPTLVGKALLVASFVQIGDAGHHAAALGIPAGLFQALSTTLILLAALLVGLRHPLPRRTARSAVPSSRPQPQAAATVPTVVPAPRRAMSVPRPTNNSPNRRRPQTRPTVTSA